MGRLAAESQNRAAATRGQAVQRVLVDGWDAAQVAATFNVDERDVLRWVAAYRRYGMASLHDDAASQLAVWRVLRQLLLALRRIAIARGEARSSAKLARFVLSRDRSARGSRH
jgi:helix-turn-helix protein